MITYAISYLNVYELTLTPLRKNPDLNINILDIISLCSKSIEIYIF